MKVLLDTNIIIHREASTVVNEDIGILFRWLDDLHHTKCVHPLSVTELQRHADEKTRRTLTAKIGSYHVLQTAAPLDDEVRRLAAEMDSTENDKTDSALVNELFCGRVDLLVTEDRRLLEKASRLGLGEKAFTIDAYLEKANAENPQLRDYGVLAVRKEVIGTLDVTDSFFDSLRDDYPGFVRWFNGKAEEPAYVCRSDGALSAFLYLKVEDRLTDYSDITPLLTPKKRLKLGTFKVSLNGFRLGERFLKIAFDNALDVGADELYVTTFSRRIEQQRLVALIEEFGFRKHGEKTSSAGREDVYVRDFSRHAESQTPSLTYPYMSAGANVFLVPIYEQYHTELFPDSILRTESPADFVENEPHRNAIRKVYISRSIERNLIPGDIVVFYRTGGYYRGVVSTLGIVEDVVLDIPNESSFVQLCRRRSVFTDAQLSEHWNYRQNSRPFIVNFLYAYSLPRRINLKRLIEMHIVRDIESAPRGFTPITQPQLQAILEESKSDARIVVG